MANTKIYIPATSKLIYIDKGLVTPLLYSPTDLKINPDYVNGVISIQTRRAEQLINNLPFAEIKVETDAVKASMTFTLTTAIAGNEVIINGLVYTGVVGVKTNNTEFSVDTSDDAAAADLADSITTDARIGITVPSMDVIATSNTNVVTVTATIGAVLGNSIDSSSGAGTIIASSATLINGTDAASVGADMAATVLYLATLIE